MAFVLKTMAKVGDELDADKAQYPHAPGASRSLQVPGQVPDRSSVPGHDELPVALPTSPVRRPLTEYGTSQRIMGVYSAKDGNETDPARFEQATVSYEELRKANPSLRTPARPTPGYALADGTRIASAGLAELAANADTDFVEG
jgi:hypothetical protein